jgi:glyoxylase-like metal-dependent hydrolase (beta-lactamase superfamily II)
MDGFQTKPLKRPKLDYPHGDVRPALGETIEVAPGIEWVSMPLPFSLKFINLWLIDDGDSWTIVDTGLPLPETRTAWKSLIEARITPNKPLKRVMVTHMHPDHVGCAGWLCHKYGADGDTFEMAGEAWDVITGNGHSPEHACLYCPSLNLLISGDQILPRISSNVSVHPTEPDADPLLDWMTSCEKLLERLPEDVLVLPAHNEPFRGAHARLRHLIDGHETGLSRLKGRMQKGPLTVMDTFTSLFGRAIQPDEVGMATGEAIAHLNCMVHRGEVVSAVGDDGVSRYELA